jgi:multicomponent Na+:H+ antiporter subunit F
VNGWLAAATALLVVGVTPCLVGTLRGTAIERLIALELGGVLTTVDLLLLARGVGRTAYLDVALLLALLSLGGSLAFARFFGRSL